MRIGIDLGGTKIEAVVMDPAGRVLHRVRRPTPQGDYRGTIDSIANLVQLLDSQVGQSCRIGMGTPGAWDLSKNVMKNCNSTWLNGQALIPDIEQRISRPVTVANDANCFALAEAISGSGKDGSVVFGVILGTGVGGGWVINDDLIVGPNAISGEWGHTPMPYVHSFSIGEGKNELRQERACYCGKINCIERFLSGPGLSETHEILTGKVRTAEQLVVEDDGYMSVTLYIDMLAQALAQIVNIMDPHVIVLGGGLSNIPRIYEEVPELIHRYAFTSDGATKLRKAVHGDSAGVIGAAWLNSA
jgi:fructokinase|tara:strand:+ start:895 stop:1800 length:906 start_codon:yes stop_codon:yes gene_type:complete